MIPSEGKAIIFTGDAEHTGIRLLMVPLLIIGVGAAYAVLRITFALIIADDSLLNLVSCTGALPLGLAFGHVGEILAKRVWPSGRECLVSPEAVSLRNKGDVLAALEFERPIEVLCWRFPLAGYPRGGRERRVPGRWHCFSCQYAQDEDWIVLFTFASPKLAERLGIGEACHDLKPESVYDRTFAGRYRQPFVRPRPTPEVLAGSDGPYWLAEGHRWEAGLELTPQDFAAAQAAIGARTRAANSDSAVVSQKSRPT